MCEQVDLSNNFLTGGYPYTELDGIMAIAEALRVTPSLTKISLAKNNLGSEGAKALAPAIRDSTSLTYIWYVADSNQVWDPIWCF